MLIVYTGKVTGAEMIEASLAKSGDSRFDDLRYIISDWSQVKEVDISTDDIKELVCCLRAMSRICPRAKCANILGRGPEADSLGAWFRFLADDLPWKIGIFYAMDKARAWCNDGG